MSDIPFAHLLLNCFFIFIKFIGVTLVNKIIQVSSVNSIQSQIFHCYIFALGFFQYQSTPSSRSVLLHRSPVCYTYWSAVWFDGVIFTTPTVILSIFVFLALCLDSIPLEHRDCDCYSYHCVHHLSKEPTADRNSSRDCWSNYIHEGMSVGCWHTRVWVIWFLIF